MLLVYIELFSVDFCRKYKLHVVNNEKKKKRYVNSNKCFC